MLKPVVLTYTKYIQISHPSMSGLKVGDKVKVQVEGRNSLGRLMISRRPLLSPPESNIFQPAASRQQNSTASENDANTKVRVLLKFLYLPKVIAEPSLLIIISKLCLFDVALSLYMYTC